MRIKSIKVKDEKVWLCRKIDPCKKLPKGAILIHSCETKADAFFTDNDWYMITTKEGTLIPANGRFIDMPDLNESPYPMLSSVDLIIFSATLPSLKEVKRLLKIPNASIV